jgi:signal peptidase I
VRPAEKGSPRPPPRGPRWLPNLLLLLLLSLAAALGFGVLVALDSPRAGLLVCGGAGLAALGVALRPLFVRGPHKILRTLAFCAILVGFLFVSAVLSFFLCFRIYVTPTGGMALAIQGVHKDVQCPECGHRFAVNCSVEFDPVGPDRQVVTGCTCENCLRRIALAPGGQRGGGRQPADVGALLGSSLGDHILVARFLTEPGEGLRRSTVIAFWHPRSTELPPEAREEFEPGGQGPASPSVYLARVAGLPGETLALSYGRLYRAQVPAAHPQDEKDDPKQRWQAKYLHSETLDFDEGPGRAFWEKHRFEILRKDPATLLALRRLVYDNDRQAADLKDVLPPRWAGGAWTPDGAGFRSGAGGAEVDWLRYRHVLRPGDWPERSDPDYAQKVEGIKQRAHKPRLIGDFLAYNSFEVEGLVLGPPRDQAGNWVGDLLLECRLTVEKPGGEFWLELSKGVDRFRARFELGTGNCTLFRVESGGKLRELQGAATRVNGPGEYRLCLANVDARLTLWVDEDLPFGDGVAYEPPGAKGPTENDLEPASVGAKGAAVQVRGLKLWRDTYYTLQTTGDDADPKGADVDPSDPKTWGPLRRLSYRTFSVPPGHYFVLKDNSRQSADSREWGTVPERLLIGRAVLVYAPRDRFGRIH